MSSTAGEAITSSRRKRVQRCDVARRGLHPEEIKAAIRMRGVTLTKLSVDSGMIPDAARLALRQQWPKAELMIATFLGVSPWEIWPDRYTEDHRPRGPRRERRAR